MVITFQGGNSFKISQGDISLVLNPKGKTAADLTLFSVGRAETSEKSGFVVHGPGEYEVKDVSVKGFPSQAPGEKINTIYIVNFENINLCFLGELAGEALSPETKESMEDIDILFAPVTANKLAVSLEPSIIIPTNFTSESLKKFLKDAGEKEVTPQDKLVVKKKDLEGKEGEIIVLKEE